MTYQNPRVSILMGSDSDFEVMKESLLIFKKFAVPCDVVVTSAHRTPERTASYVRDATRNGIEAFIVGAGAAAHLAGVVAAETVLPVIGVPISATSLNGMDALLSTVQMPGGIPVATMAIGKAGARNAALFVIEMMAVHDTRLRDELHAYRENFRNAVAEKSDALQEIVRKLLDD